MQKERTLCKSFQDFDDIVYIVRRSVPFGSVLFFVIEKDSFRETDYT